MQLIESKTLGSAQASIEFTNIPQDGTDLLLVVSGRSTAADIALDCLISFNGSTSNFTARQLYGYGTTVGSNTTARQAGGFPGATSTADTFSNISIYIPNYAGATNKSYSADSVAENNNTTSFNNIVAGLWSVTTAISSLAVASGAGGNLATGSMASLYKITKGSDGTTTVA